MQAIKSLRQILTKRIQLLEQILVIVSFDEIISFDFQSIQEKHRTLSAKQRQTNVIFIRSIIADQKFKRQFHKLSYQIFQKIQSKWKSKRQQHGIYEEIVFDYQRFFQIIGEKYIKDFIWQSFNKNQYSHTTGIFLLVQILSKYLRMKTQRVIKKQIQKMKKSYIFTQAQYNKKYFNPNTSNQSNQLPKVLQFSKLQKITDLSHSKNTMAKERIYTTESLISDSRRTLKRRVVIINDYSKQKFQGITRQSQEKDNATNFYRKNNCISSVKKQLYQKTINRQKQKQKSNKVVIQSYVSSKSTKFEENLCVNLDNNTSQLFSKKGTKVLIQDKNVSRFFGIQYPYLKSFYETYQQQLKFYTNLTSLTQCQGNQVRYNGNDKNKLDKRNWMNNRLKDTINQMLKRNVNIQKSIQNWDNNVKNKNKKLKFCKAGCQKVNLSNYQ